MAGMQTKPELLTSIALRKLSVAVKSADWISSQSGIKDAVVHIVRLASDAASSVTLRHHAVSIVGNMAFAADYVETLQNALRSCHASSVMLQLLGEAKDEGATISCTGLEPKGKELATSALVALGHLLSHPSGILDLGSSEVAAARERMGTDPPSSSSKETGKASLPDLRQVQVELFRKLLPAWAACIPQCVEAAVQIINSAQRGMLDEDVLADAGLL